MSRSFHWLLGLGALPVVAVPFQWLAVLRGERRLWWLALLDTIIGACAIWIVVADQPAPPPPPRIGIYEDFSKRELGPGAHVGAVLEGSPADEAEILRGEVIVGIDSSTVAGFADLSRELAQEPPGVTRRLRVQNSVGETRSVSITPRELAVPPVASPSSSRGLFDPWTDQCFEGTNAGPWSWATAIVWVSIVLFWLIALIIRSPIEPAWRWTALALGGAAVGGLGTYSGMCVALSGPTRAGVMAAILLQPLAMFAIASAGKKRLDRVEMLELRAGETLPWPRVLGLAAFYIWSAMIRLAIVMAFVRTLDAEVLNAPRAISDMYGPELGEGTPGLVALAIAAVLIAPFAEEYVFRGILLPALATRMPPYHALALSSILFALLHGTSHKQFVGVVLILGLALGWARMKSGGLKAPIALHMFVNLTAVLPALLT